MSRLFDAYLAVDWSARSVRSPARPSPDAIWVGETGSPERYFRTRHAAREYLAERIAVHCAEGRRVFAGFDFAFGYPAGFARALGLADQPQPGSVPGGPHLTGPVAPWRSVWRELQRLVVDGADNRNNRFAVAAELNRRCGAQAPGPLWGCPPARACPTLAATSPGFPYPAGSDRLAHWRWVDRRTRGIQPVWKLLGNGSVGSQSLLGIPVVASLRFDTGLSDVSRVWPFETGFAPPPAGTQVLYAEIWPSLFRSGYDPAVPIRDQAQVRAVVEQVSAADRAGTLAALFQRPEGLPEEAAAAAQTEEGWILGL